ncbi:unnamed protein product [Ambrosiozyma monospora]|uniref:Ubiquitin-related modifier 1 n=1 Tax=Ambrosiozyma monospora TaxID=43982 RepID=A0A9W6Z8H2_AMBMO|nr:unnamed protein product [Ambrosiozyma monospora]
MIVILLKKFQKRRHQAAHGYMLHATGKGGLDVIFGGQKYATFKFKLPTTSTTTTTQPTMQDLLHLIVKNLLVDKKDRCMFVVPVSGIEIDNEAQNVENGGVKDGVKEDGEDGDEEEEVTVTPGILVLVNDTDWELEGELEYVLEDGDLISFTSTLHGG